MDRLDISRLHATYRLAPSQRGVRDRLDRILEEVVGDGLDDALDASAALTADEVVCVRSLTVPVVIRLDMTDRAASQAWGAVVVRALEAAIARGGPGVVRYPSRHHAFVDLAVSAARDDVERTWAWRGLGIWHLPDGAASGPTLRAVVRVLSAEPATIIPVLRALAAEGLAERFIRGIGEEGVLALAGAAVVAAQVPADSLDQGLDVVTAARETADRLIARSVLGGPSLTIGAALGSSARRALAVLLLLEIDPGVVHGRVRATQLVDAISDQIGGRPEATVDAGRRADSRRGAGDGGPTVAATTGTGREVAASPSPADIPAEIARPTVAATHARVHGDTDSAGLLYLVRVIGQLGIPAELASAPAYGHRPVRWWLHRIAMTLAAIRANDPAALAFAGLAPDARPPSVDEPDATPAERRAARRFATRIALALARQLDRRGESPRAVLGSVCARHGEIVADPGWFEVRMPLHAVDIAIRRAGLDLDPGYVPWLGVVLRFGYG